MYIVCCRLSVWLSVCVHECMYARTHTHTHAGAVCVDMCMYVSPGPLPSMLAVELLPNHLRAAGMSLLLTVCTLCNVAVASSWPVLQAQLGSGRLLGVYSCMIAVAFVFARHFVPETAGLPLEHAKMR